ncbi:molybdate transport system ATP-binding protein [Methylophilus rhizosphaerae]|uniref:Molybdate transport system ATP-binding protein n=1 Tax=Methylophilus rhizosphaerae TaxID=492660 RepID=A0A1G9DAW8_9PROT|nr:ATP-binding cassette domain-containing protein [Methylophilus rhizosphaerae]SDK60943.1 molybdate transport system ATP-binding protein [Methylophilus rhizosphaerae]
MLQVDIQIRQPYAANAEAFALQARFELRPGHCLGIMGASGSGKTTLLHTISGLLMPASGTIHSGHQCWFDAERGIQWPPWQRHVGMVFQDGRLFPHLSVLQNLAYGMPSGGRISLEEVIAVLEIGHLARRRPGQLSGGEKQRVAIGRALLSQPVVLLMDEPLSGLDEALKQQVLPYIKKVMTTFGLPTLYVSHVREEVAEIADEMLILAQGQLRQPI